MMPMSLQHLGCLYLQGRVEMLQGRFYVAQLLFGEGATVHGLLILKSYSKVHCLVVEAFRIGTLAEDGLHNRIAFLPMADRSGSYSRYLGKLDKGKMKIRGVMARKGDAPEYAPRMQLESFEVLSRAGN